ncbi:unnamed protein product [Malus baccata var. baccata]
MGARRGGAPHQRMGPRRSSTQTLAGTSLSSPHRSSPWRCSTPRESDLAVEVFHTNAPKKMDLLLLRMTRLASA